MLWNEVGGRLGVHVCGLLGLAAWFFENFMLVCVTQKSQNHATNTTKPCKSTTTNPPNPTQTIQCSSHAPQQTSLLIYSTSCTSFPV